MYADRYAHQARLNPATLSIAIAINAAFVAALMFSSPKIPLIGHRDPPLQTYSVPPEAPPPPPEKSAPPRARTERAIDIVRVPQPPIPSHSAVDLTTTVDPGPPPPPDTGGFGTVTVDPPAPPPPLPFVDAIADPRYARDFQPDYPASERRAERDGRVTVKVLIGVDGRVKEVRRVAATSDAFFQATLDQALRRWRFRAATRGGVPVETWRTMSLTFVMQD